MNHNITFIQNKITNLYDGITKLANADSTQLVSYTDFYGVTRNIGFSKKNVFNPLLNYGFGTPVITKHRFWFQKQFFRLLKI